MSGIGESRAEAFKLARLLGHGSEQLAYLHHVPASELRDYREAVTDLLFDGDRALFQRAADASRLLPAHTVAMISERALGPLICARITGLLDPRRAAEIARHLSIEFLAQLAAELDPRRAVDVVTATPPQRVLEIALLMAARGEHVAMGRFVAHLDEETLVLCTQRLADEDLLRIWYVLEGKERLSVIVEFAGLERTQQMLDNAESMRLGEEARDLLDHLDAHQRERLGHRAGV